MTLHSDDGTTENGRSFTTFDVINEEGKLLVCGWICFLGPYGPIVVFRL